MRISSNVLRLTGVCIYLTVIVYGFYLTSLNDGYSTTLSLIWRYVSLPIAACFLAFTVLVSKNSYKHTNYTCKFATSSFLILFIVLYLIIVIGLKYSKMYYGNYELFDLGVYLNKLYIIQSDGIQSAINEAALHGHFQPVLLIYSYMYNVTRNFFFVPLVQTIALTSGVIPVYLLSKNVLKSKECAVLSCYLYLLNPILLFNDILGFHPDHLVLPLFLWSFYFCECKKYKASLSILLVVPFVSEPWILSAACFGLYLILKNKEIRFGVFTVGLFAFVFFLIMYILSYAGSKNGLASVISGGFEVLKGPSNNILFPNLFAYVEKLFEFYFILAALAFIPIAFVTPLVVALPDIMKVLLSDERYYYSVEGHYTLVLFSCVLVSAIYGARTLNEKYTVNKIYTLHAMLIFTLTLGIAHSPHIYSYDFWSRWSGGAFNYLNYTDKQIRQSYDKIFTMIDYDKNPKVEINNSAFYFLLAKNSNRLELFPSDNYMVSDLIILNKNGNFNSGSEKSKRTYLAHLNSALAHIEKTHLAIYQDANFTAYINKFTCEKFVKKEYNNSCL